MSEGTPGNQAKALNVGPAVGAPPHGSSQSEQPWRVLAIPLASLLSIALFLLATGEPPPPPKPAQGLRTTIRVLLVKAAPSIKLQLEGSWKVVAQGSDQAPLVVTDLGEVTLSAASWTPRRSALSRPSSTRDRIRSWVSRAGAIEELCACGAKAASSG